MTMEKEEWPPERRDSRRKLTVVLESLLAGRKVNNYSWDIEKMNAFDLYRYLKRHGKIKYSRTKVDRSWGPYFEEAVAVCGDFIVTIERELMDINLACTIYHRSGRKINKFWNSMAMWISKNNSFRGKCFTYPGLSKPKLVEKSYMSEKAISAMEENVVLFFRNLDALRKHGIKTKRGVILYGNPGNGKTSICRWICASLPDVTRIWVTDWYVRPGDIENLFAIARKLAPAIIFLEDIDTAGVSRRYTHGVNPLLGKLLNEMDGIERNDGIIVVATTNNIYALDEALRNRPGRFDTKIRIGNPHPKVVESLTGHADKITLAEAFRRREDRIYYEKILGRKYSAGRKQRQRLHYIG